MWRNRVRQKALLSALVTCCQNGEVYIKAKGRYLMQVLPPFSAPPWLVGIKVSKRDKCQFGENQSKIRFFFSALHLLYLVWRLISDFLSQSTWEGCICNSSWEIWGAGSLTPAFFRKNNVYFNEFPFISGWNTKKKNHLEEPSLFWPALIFWHLE